MSGGLCIMFKLPQYVLVNKDENNQSIMKDFTKIYINNREYSLYSITQSHDTAELRYVSKFVQIPATWAHPVTWEYEEFNFKK